MLKDLELGFNEDVLVSAAQDGYVFYYDKDYILMGNSLYKNNDTVDLIKTNIYSHRVFIDENERYWFYGSSYLFTMKNDSVSYAILDVTIYKILTIKDGVLHAQCQTSSYNGAEGTSLRKIAFSITSDALTINSNELIYSDSFKTDGRYERMFYYKNNIYWYEYISSTEDRTKIQRYNLDTNIVDTVETAGVNSLGINSYDFYGASFQDMSDTRYLYVLGSTSNKTKTQKIDLETLKIEKQYDFQCDIRHGAPIRHVGSVMDGMIFVSGDTDTISLSKVFDLELNKDLLLEENLSSDFKIYNISYFAKNKSESFITFVKATDSYSKSVLVLKKYQYEGVCNINLKENILFSGYELPGNESLALLEDADEMISGELYASLKEDVRRDPSYVYDCSEQFPSDMPPSINQSTFFSPMSFSKGKYWYKTTDSYYNSNNALMSFTKNKGDEKISFTFSLSRVYSTGYIYFYVSNSKGSSIFESSAYLSEKDKTVDIDISNGTNGEQLTISVYIYWALSLYINKIVFPYTKDKEESDFLFARENILFTGDELPGASSLALIEDADEMISGRFSMPTREDIRRLADYLFDFSVQVPTDVPSTIDIAQLYKGFTCDITNKYLYSNATSDYSATNSYIKFEAQANQVISLKAKVSSEGGYDFGFAHVTTTADIPLYSTTINRFVCISGTVGWATYTYTIPTDGTYYLHLGYRKDGSGSSGSDRVWFTDIKFPGKTIVEAFNNAFNLLDNIIDAEAGHAVMDLLENAIDATPGDALLTQQESIWAQENSDLALDEKACEAGFIDGFNLIEKAYRSEASGLALKEKAYTQEVNGFDVKEKVFDTLYINNLDLEEAIYQGYDYYLALKERTQAQENVLLPLIQMTYAGSGYNSLNLAISAYIKAYASLPIREYIIALPGVNFALYETINKQDGKSVYLLEHIRHPYLNMYEHIHADGYKTQLINSSRNLIPINRNGATR